MAYVLDSGTRHESEQYELLYSLTISHRLPYFPVSSSACCIFPRHRVSLHTALSRPLSYSTSCISLLRHLVPCHLLLLGFLSPTSCFGFLDTSSPRNLAPCLQTHRQSVPYPLPNGVSPTPATYRPPFLLYTTCTCVSCFFLMSSLIISCIVCLIPIRLQNPCFNNLQLVLPTNFCVSVPCVSH